MAGRLDWGTTHGQDSRPAMTDAQAPRVTVLMPAYNAGPYLAQALDSVCRQTFDDFELLVIDDGSTDNTREVLAQCRDPRLRTVLHSTNAGLAVRLNEGLALARGTLIARLDADDVAHPSRLALQVAALDREPVLSLVGGYAVNISGDGTFNSMGLYPTSPREISWACCFDSPFNHSAITFRRDAVMALGGYDKSCGYAEDFELWSRLIRSGLVGRNLPVALAAYRRHGQQMTASNADLKVRSNIAIIGRNLDFFFPDTPPVEREAMAKSIAETHFGIRPVTAAYLSRYRVFLSAFCRRFQTPILSLRRTIGAQLLGFASLAKPHMPLAAIALLIAAAGFSPEALTGLVLPPLLRSRLATRAGRFWEHDGPAERGTRPRHDV